jgi:hypothetical protein
MTKYFFGLRTYIFKLIYFVSDNLSPLLIKVNPHYWFEERRENLNVLEFYTILI